MNPNSSATSPELIFVYGTLMSQYGSPPEGTLVGPAEIKGYKMYDMGSFPAIVRDARSHPNGHSNIKGELYVLEDPERELQALDRYEGVVWGLYRREKATVLCQNESVTAWVYIFAKPITGQHLVESGSWLQYKPTRR